MAVLALVGRDEALPAPPYPVNTRAKGWRFEIDYERVKQSATWAVTPLEIRPWLLILWCEAWGCSPCGSLENDDSVIAGRMGMPINLFRVHREALMRGWRLHSDGRLYHHVVTEAVERVLQFRDKEARRQSGWRDRRSLQNQHFVNNVTRDTRVSHAGPTAPEPEPVLEPIPEPAPVPLQDASLVLTANHSEEKNQPTRARALDGAFDEFWCAYPKKVGKDDARRAWRKIREPVHTLQEILAALAWQRTSEQWTKNGGQFVPNPATYLNRGHWKDEPQLSGVEQWLRRRTDQGNTIEGDRHEGK